MGWAWEVGATLSHFGGDADHDYGEAFGGLIGEGWSARLYNNGAAPWSSVPATTSE